MAFEFNDLKKIMFLVLFFIIPLTSTTNIDCNGKPYYCVNSTHFMICVDLGGKISTTIDNFVLECPPTTECRASNRYECEFPHDEETTSQPVRNISMSDDINVLPRLTLGVSTILSSEVTTKSHKTQTETVLPALQENISSDNTEILEDIRKEFTDGKDTVFESITTKPSNMSHNESPIKGANTFAKEIFLATDETYSTETTTEKATSFHSLNQGSTTMLPIEITIKSQLTQTNTVLPMLQANIYSNTTEILEDIRKEFTDSKDTVFQSINTNPSNVSHSEDEIIGANTFVKQTIIDTDKTYSTETTTKKATSYYALNQDITTILPIEVTAKSPLTTLQTVLPMLEENISSNNTEFVADIRKGFTDSKDTVFESITTEPSNVSHNEGPIIGANIFAKETYIDTDKIYSTETITEKTTAFYSLNQGTILPIEVTTKSPLTHTETVLPVLEKNTSSNTTETLEDIRKEFTDGKDTVLISINAIPPNDVSHIEKQIIAANIPAKETTTSPGTNKIYSTETTTENATSFYTTQIILEDTLKSFDITILADNFNEANYKDTPHQNKFTEPFPMDNKEVGKKDIDIETTSFYPHIDTEQRINLEKPPDYSKAKNQTDTNDNSVLINTATDYSIDETRPTTKILKINIEHDKSGNISDVIETVAKTDNILMIALMQNKNITNDESNSTNKTPPKTEENDYIKFYTLQDEQLRENNTQVNFLPSTESYVSITSTYNITWINNEENNTNVKEQYNFNLKVNNLTNPFISPTTEFRAKSSLRNSSEFILQNGEISKIQGLSSTEIPISIDINITDNKVKSFTTLNTSNIITYGKPEQNNLTLNKSFGNKNIGEELKLINVKTDITYQRYDKLNNSDSQDKKNIVYQTMKPNKEQFVENKPTTEKYDEPITLTATEPNLDTEIITSEPLNNLLIKPTQQTATSDILKSKNFSQLLGDITLVNESPDTILSLSPKNYSTHRFDKFPSTVELTIFNLKSAANSENNNLLDQGVNMAADDISVGNITTTDNTIGSANDMYQVTENINYTSPLLDVVNNNKSDDETDFHRAKYTTTMKPRKLPTSYIETLKHSYVNSIGSKEIKPNSTAKNYEEDVKKFNDISVVPAATTKKINKIYVESTNVVKLNDIEPTPYTTLTPTISITDVRARNGTMLNGNIHSNLTETVKLEEPTTVSYNITTNKESTDHVLNKENQKTYFPSSEDVLLLTSTDSLSNTITQVTNVPPKAITVDEILNKIVIDNITPKRPIATVQNLSLLSHTNKEAETEYSTISKPKTYEGLSTTPIPKAASLGTISTGNETTVIETIVEKPLISAIKQVTDIPFASVTQVKTATLLSKVEKDREQLTEPTITVTNEPFLNDLLIMVVTNTTVLPTTVIEENIFINPIKLEMNKTSSRETVSLNTPNVTDSRFKPFTKVFFSGKVLNTDPASATGKRQITKSMTPTTIMPPLRELLPVAGKEAIETDEESLTQLMTTKNEMEILGTTMISKTMDDGKIQNRVKQTTTVPLIDEFASINVMQVTAATPLTNKITRLSSLVGSLNKPIVKETKGTLLSKPVLVESNIIKAIKSVANITMSEEIFTTNEAQLGTTTTIPKIVNDEKPLTKLVTHAAYLREPLDVNVMQITERTQFPTMTTTVTSENTFPESSRPITNMLATEQLLTRNVIETTLLKSSTENPFTTIGYGNNEKIAIVKHLGDTKGLGPVNSVSTTYSRINEQVITNSKIARKLVAAPIVETTESMRPGNLEFTETSISYKGPSVMINESYLKQVTPLPPTISSNVETNIINTDKIFTVPAIIKATVKETTRTSPTVAITRENGNDSNNFFITEISQPVSSKIIHSAENMLQSVPFERVTEPLIEPSSAIEMINVTDLKTNKDVTVAPKMLGQKDTIQPASQNSDQSNKYTALYSKIENTAINSKELNNKKYKHLEMSNISSVATEIKVGFQDDATDEGEELSTANNYRATTTSPDLLIKNYNKGDISTTPHIFNLPTGPSTNVDHIQMPQSGKPNVFIYINNLYIFDSSVNTEESNIHIYKSVNNVTHVLDNHKTNLNKSNTLAINIPGKVNEANKKLKGDTISSKIQNHSLHYTTSYQPYHNISYTQAQQNLNSSIPSAIHITNPKENLNKSAFKCLNHSLGKYADNTDCRKFYICVGKLRPIIGTCPNKTVFSEINRHCTRNLSHCVRNNQFHCLYEGRFVDFIKDNIYFICVKNNSHGFVRYKLQCLKGYHINKVTIKCEKDIDISESASEISENYQANSSQNGSNKWDESEISENKRYFECKKEGNFPYAKDCKKYYMCSKNKNGAYRRKIKTCPSEQVYDKDKNKCAVADGSDEC